MLDDEASAQVVQGSLGVVDARTFAAAEAVFDFVDLASADALATVVVQGAGA